ncbi:lactosylceramide 4-alpha-galactosyltransferase-like [Anopheles cruzii]|uniref:lactosylceramide 4-alpha-galactosyltransferase-like n=1 Tax=Anopheles cruzii TaxID=68878 RepID=UPI0022EC7FD4|nr:lactosylceramide 4-alpha-galactosyltransferase-like [Anopheles cruzii]
MWQECYIYKKISSDPLSAEVVFRSVDETGFLRVFDDSDELRKDYYSNVYFIESSAPFNPFVTIDARQACAIESAARANPLKNIVVLFASWSEFTDSGQLHFPDILLLSQFENLYFRWLSLDSFAKGTPLEEVIKSERVHSHKNGGAAYLSEILRLLLLYRVGGIYLDLDVITLKPLEFSNPNFFGAETHLLAGSSVMGLQREGYGHIFLDSCLNDFQGFDRHEDNRNGSIMITYKLLQACEALIIGDIVDRGCQGRLELYPRHTFHPFDETNVHLLFDPDNLDEVREIIADSMTVHMRHQTSRQFQRAVIDGETTGYAMIAQKYCPSVYDFHDGKL